MRKITLRFIIITCVLMLYTACDPDNEQFDGEPPPGSGGPGEPSAPVPRTGQTMCWNSTGVNIPCAGTGQDGDIQAGVAWPIPRFTDNGNGTITDNLTGLIWLKDANCRGSSTWDQALNVFVFSLANGECGLTDNSRAGDWDLPNRNELLSLLDLGNSEPTLPTGHPFMNFQTIGRYWSSTTAVDSTRDAWVVEFVNGNTSPLIKVADSFVAAVRRDTSNAPAPVPRTGQTMCWNSAGQSIRCSGSGQDGDIRAGVVWPVPRFTDNGNGTVTDNLTGLIWLKNANCNGPVTWDEAFGVVDILANGICGLSDGSMAGDWHLPNRNQLLSLIDLQNFNPALPTGHPFMNFQSSGYWSSTTSNIRNIAWLVNFGIGVTDGARKAGSTDLGGNDVFVTAVRGDL